MLQEYLDAEMRRRWAWGRVDCVQFATRWARLAAGRALTPIPIYGTRDEATKVLARHGGLESMVRRWMSENGFTPTKTPEDGDVGLAVVPVEHVVVAPVAFVIRCGPWWVSREVRGIGGGNLQEVCAWRVGT
jgi:hypothetical protein